MSRRTDPNSRSNLWFAATLLLLCACDRCSEGGTPGGTAASEPRPPDRETTSDGNRAAARPTSRRPYMGRSPADPARRPTSSESDASTPARRRPEPRVIEVGETVEQVIRSPDSLANRNLEFETDWYALTTRAGKTVEVSLEPSPGSDLLPMVTVLSPNSEGASPWSTVDARRGRTEGESLELRIAVERGETNLIAVDDARNLARNGEAPTSANFHGGPRYAYSLAVERPTERDSGN